MLITEAYAREQRIMHQNERYGAASKKFAPQVIALIKDRRPKTILDYGAGKQVLTAEIADFLQDAEVVSYDPGVPDIADLPDDLFDLVCCIDVLEHIEPECLDDVIQSISARTHDVAFITIHTGPAGKALSDGRNAHLIQRPLKWWRRKLQAYFPEVKAKMYNETTILAICEGWK